MIDCTITENYFKEKARMCENIVCKDCIFDGYRYVPCVVDVIQKCVDAVQAWSDAHPI